MKTVWIARLEFSDAVHIHVFSSQDLAVNFVLDETLFGEEDGSDRDTIEAALNDTGAHTTKYGETCVVYEANINESLS